MSAASGTLAVLYYVCLPFIWIFKILLALLIVVTSPLLHLAHYVLRACWIPFQFLAKFETLYIYFGVALLVGVLFGALIHHTARYVVSLLGVDQPAEQGKTLAIWRAERAGSKGRRKEDVLLSGLHERLSRPAMSAPPDWLQHDKGGLRSPSGLMSTTILEEDDSSELDYV